MASLFSRYRFELNEILFDMETIVGLDLESDPSYLSVCQLFEDYFKRTKDSSDYVSVIN